MIQPPEIDVAGCRPTPRNVTPQRNTCMDLRGKKLRGEYLRDGYYDRRRPIADLGSDMGQTLLYTASGMRRLLPDTLDGKADHNRSSPSFRNRDVSTFSPSFW